MAHRRNGEGGEEKKGLILAALLLWGGRLNKHAGMRVSSAY